MAHTLIHNVPPFLTPRQAAASALGFLLSFDIYGRSNDVVSAKVTELRKSRASIHGTEFRTLTLWPGSESRRSKMPSKIGNTAK